jgi:hypothetical protein
MAALQLISRNASPFVAVPRPDAKEHPARKETPRE